MYDFQLNNCNRYCTLMSTKIDLIEVFIQITLNYKEVYYT